MRDFDQIIVNKSGAGRKQSGDNTQGKARRTSNSVHLRTFVTREILFVQGDGVNRYLKRRGNSINTIQPGIVSHQLSKGNVYS